MPQQFEVLVQLYQLIFYEFSDSNCSLLFLSIWGDLKTVYLSILVGNGIGPLIVAPVLLTVLTISSVDWSKNLIIVSS